MEEQAVSLFETMKVDCYFLFGCYLYFLVGGFFESTIVMAFRQWFFRYTSNVQNRSTIIHCVKLYLLAQGTVL